MTALQLYQSIPDLDKRINKALVGYDALHELPNVLFHQGAFINKFQYLKGLLGLGTTIEATLQVFPDEQMIEHKTPETIFITPEFGVTIDEISNQFNRKQEGIEGQILIDEKTPLELKVTIRANVDHEKIKGHGSPAIVQEYIKEAGLDIVENAPLDFRKQYPVGNMMKVLDWLKNNVTYGSFDKNEFDYELKLGKCDLFARLFIQMVNQSGGLAHWYGTHTFNLPYKGYPYFMVLDKVGTHALAFIHLDDDWQIIDPTTYNTTANNKEIPDGVEMRSIDQELGNYQFIEINLPKVMLMDRPTYRDIDSETQPISHEIIKRKSQPERFKEKHPTLPIKIAKESLKIIQKNYDIIP